MRFSILIILAVIAISARAEEKFLLQNPRQTTTSITAIDNVDSLTAIAVGYAGLVLRTTDAGTTWAQMNSVSGASFNCIDVYDSTLAVAAGLGGKIFRSTDKGQSWSAAVTPVTIPIAAIAMGSRRTGVAIANSPFTILRTTDGGQNWTQSTSIPAQFQVLISGVSMADSAVGIIVGNDGTIYRSIDSGATWVVLDASSCPTCTGFLEWYVGVDMEASPIGFAAPLQGFSIIKTTNRGLLWTKVDSIQTSCYSIKASHDGQTVMAVGTYGRSALSTDGGTTWQHIMIPGVPPSTQYYYGDLAVMSHSTIIAVGDNGVIARTTNAGATFELVSGLTGALITSIATTPAGRGFAGSANGDLLHTTNGGDQWNIVSRPSSSNAIRAMQYLANDTLVAVGDGGAAFRTGDDGASWDPGTSGITASLSALDASGKIIVAVGAAGNTVRSLDGGNVWEQNPITPATDLYSVKLTSTPKGILGIAVGKSGAIFRSLDTAQTWDQITGVTTNDLLSLALIDSMHATAVGAKGTYCETTDGGVNWNVRDIGSSNTSSLAAIALDGNGDGGLIENNGRNLLRTTDGGKTWMIESFPLAGDRFVLNAIAPHTWYLGGPNAIIQKRIHGMVACDDSLGSGDVKTDSIKDTSLVIHNTGSNRLIIQSISQDSAPAFTVSLALPDTIATGDSTTLSVRFTPHDERQYFDRVVIVSDGVRDTTRVALRGRGIHTSTVSEESVSTSDLALELFPNPARNEIQIFWRTKNKSVTIELEDVLGRNVGETLLHHKEEGSDRVSVTQLPRGTYIARANDGSRIVTKLFVKE